ncbi:MAG: hypothetical protein ACRDL5_05645, partial [Solirubrobacteraceae bacterium]
AFGIQAPIARPSLAAPLRRLRDALADGDDPPAAFRTAELDAHGGLAALAELELAGLVRRGPGGRFTVLP